VKCRSIAYHLLFFHLLYLLLFQKLHITLPGVFKDINVWLQNLFKQSGRFPWVVDWPITEHKCRKSILYPIWHLNPRYWCPAAVGSTHHCSPPVLYYDNQILSGSYFSEVGRRSKSTEKKPGEMTNVYKVHSNKGNYCNADWGIPSYIVSSLWMTYDTLSQCKQPHLKKNSLWKVCQQSLTALCTFPTSD
jgi:hypothetical protein